MENFIRELFAWVKIIVLCAILIYAKAYIESERTMSVTIKSIGLFNQTSLVNTSKGSYYNVSQSKVVCTDKGSFYCTDELLLLDFHSTRRFQSLIVGKRYNIKLIGVFSQNIIDAKPVE